MAKSIVPLIMCGGAGTRLWPASREGRPKQFLPLFGPESTFQDTIRRVSHPASFGRPIVITNAQYRFLAAEQLAAIGIEADIILEPLRAPPLRPSATAIRSWLRLPPITSSRMPRPLPKYAAWRPMPRREAASSLSACGRRGRRPSTAISAPGRRSGRTFSPSSNSSRSPTRQPPSVTSKKATSGIPVTSCSAQASYSTNIAAWSRIASPPSSRLSTKPATTSASSRSILSTLRGPPQNRSTMRSWSAPSAPR